MAIAYRSNATATTASATTSLTINTPTGTAANDVLILSIAIAGGTSVTVSTPSGWTLIRSDTRGTSVRVSTFSRVATASEPANVAVSWSGGNFNAAGGIAAYSGADTAAPINAHDGQGNASSTSVTAPGVTTTAANCRLVGLFSAIGVPSTTPPSGMTERWDIDTGSSSSPNNVTLELSDQALGAAGATGDRVATLSAAQPNVGMLVALKEAASGVTTSFGAATTAKGVSTTSFGATTTAVFRGGTIGARTSAVALPTIVASSSAVSSAAVTSLSANVPTGTKNDDLLIAQLCVRGASTVTITPPAGWTLINRTDDGTNVFFHATYWRAAASEPASYSWSWSVAGNATLGLLSLRGAHLTSPINASSAQANASGSTAPAAGITTTSPNCALLGLWCAPIGGSFVPPTELLDNDGTEVLDKRSTDSANNITSLLTYERHEIAGLSGNRTASPSSAARSIGALVAIAPGLPKGAESLTDISFAARTTAGDAITMFGNRQIGQAGLSAQNQIVAFGPFTLSEEADTSAVVALMQGGDTDQAIRALIYAHDSTNSRPGALLGISSELVISAQSALAWRSFSLAVQPTAGQYWHALWFGGSGDASLSIDHTGGAHHIKATPYSSAGLPESPFPPPETSGAYNGSIYAAYTPHQSGATPSSATAQAGGNGTLGDTFTGPGEDRVSGQNLIYVTGPFRMPEAGTLSSFKAWLSGGANAQDVRGVLYTNDTANGYDKPGAHVVTTSEVTIAANAAGQHVTFPTAAVNISAGYYWEGIWFGGAGDADFHLDQYARTRMSKTQAYARTGNAPASLTSATGDNASESRNYHRIGLAYFTYTTTAIPAPGAGSTRLSPAELPATTYLSNGLSGPHRWRGEETIRNEANTGPITARDDYDRFHWRSLEPTRDNYDFSPISNAIANARARNQVFSLRIRAMESADSGRTFVPDYLRNAANGWATTSTGTWIPNWNSNEWLTRMEALLNAIAAQFANDTGWVDVGMYGQNGEWAVGAIPYGSDPNSSGYSAATTANKQRIVNAHVNAFANNPMVLKFGSVESLAPWGLALSNRMGMRADNWAHSYFGSHLWGAQYREARQLLRERWKTAPMLGEPAGGGSFVPNTRDAMRLVVRLNLSTIGNGNYNPDPSLSDQAIYRAAYNKMGYRFAVAHVDVPSPISLGSVQTWKTWWHNRNVAVPYEAWTATFVLRNQSTGAQVWSGNSTVNLKTIYPTGANPVSHNDSLTVSGIAAGIYDLFVKVTHDANKRAPMYLAHSGRTANNEYLLGAVSVSGATSVFHASEVATQTLGVAGATGTRAATVSIASTSVAQLVALKPAVVTSAWKWTQAKRALIRLYRRVSVRFGSGNPSVYVATTSDINGETSWRYFAGIGADGYTLTEYSTQAAAEAAAQPATSYLYGFAEFPAEVEALYLRLYHRANPGYRLDEFTPISIIRADAIEAGSIQGYHIGTVTLTATGTIVAGPVTINNVGIDIEVGSILDDANAYTFTNSTGQIIGGTYGFWTATQHAIYLRSLSLSGQEGRVHIEAASPAGTKAALDLRAYGGTNYGGLLLEHYGQANANNRATISDMPLVIEGNLIVGTTTTIGGSSIIRLGSGTTGNRNAIIDLHGDDTYTDYSLRLVRQATGANANSQLAHHGTGALQIVAVDAGEVHLATSNTVRVVVDDAGNVGIGNTAPSHKLHVSGTARFTSYLDVMEIATPSNPSNTDRARLYVKESGTGVTQLRMIRYNGTAWEDIVVS